MNFPEDNFQPDRYIGRWYEIAKYPMIYEVGCTGATADYFLQEDGIRVLNTCLLHGKATRQDWGTALFTNEDGVFMLSFDKFGPQAPQTPYRVLWTDYENWAFVGDQDQDYYFILSRYPQVKKGDFTFLYDQTVELGFDTKRAMVNPDANYIV